MDVTAVRKQLAAHGQGHLLNGYDALEEAQKKRLLEEVANINFLEINNNYKGTVENNNASKSMLHKVRVLGAT